jgi:hypothetical protein
MLNRSNLKEKLAEGGSPARLIETIKIEYMLDAFFIKKFCKLLIFIVVNKLIDKTMIVE